MEDCSYLHLPALIYVILRGKLFFLCKILRSPESCRIATVGRRFWRLFTFTSLLQAQFSRTDCVRLFHEVLNIFRSGDSTSFQGSLCSQFAALIRGFSYVEMAFPIF